MGQKVDPRSFRLGVTQTCRSNWIAKSKKDYARQVKRDYLIRQAIEKEYKDFGVARIDIAASSNNVTVDVHTARVGIIEKGTADANLKERAPKTFGGKGAKKAFLAQIATRAQ